MLIWYWFVHLFSIHLRFFEPFCKSCVEEICCEKGCTFKQLVWVLSGLNLYWILGSFLVRHRPLLKTVAFGRKIGWNLFHLSENKEYLCTSVTGRSKLRQFPFKRRRSLLNLIGVIRDFIKHVILHQCMLRLITEQI